MFRSFKIALLTACALALGTAVAMSASDPIAARKAMMKNTGEAMKVIVPMVKGEAEYDAVKAELAVRVINSTANGITSMFPEDSKTGGETTAAPAIWEKMADFDATGDKFATDSAAAVAAAPQGLDAFKTAFGTMAGNCKACHDGFRVKKE
jgi:cytochrome c556